MNAELSILIDKLTDPKLHETSVIEWGAPVISFGDFSSSKIATIGLNPSNREFVDVRGEELNGDSRRFHTLGSLGLLEWSEVNEDHIEQIYELCKDYFSRNPYDGWFKSLDYLISGTQTSYYFPSFNACHLDLIPYATSCKWTELSSNQRSLLLELTGDTLGILLKNSSIELLVLNGRTVVEHFQNIADSRLESRVMPSWTLPRKSGDGVSGISYKGSIRNLGGVDLGREITVLGYNHNIQSSFGVTTQVKKNIRSWITKMATEIFNETC